jgi:hypothetical protein
LNQAGAKSAIAPHMNESVTTPAQSLAKSEVGDNARAGASDKSTTPSGQVSGAILHQDNAHYRTTALPPELVSVVKAWPELPEAVRAGILAMVKAVAVPNSDRRGDEGTKVVGTPQ